MFQIKTTDRNIKRAAVVRGAGHTVTTIKLPASPRCAFEYQDSPEIREILDAYEMRQVLPIPQKAIMQAYSALLAECKGLNQGRLGGGIDHA